MALTLAEMALIEAALRTHHANTFPTLAERLAAKTLWRKLTQAATAAHADKDRTTATRATHPN